MDIADALRADDGGRAFEYERDGKRYRYDISRQRDAEIDTSSTGDASRGARGRAVTTEAPDRGRQLESTTSPM